MASNNSSNDHHVSNGHCRNPESTQAWLIGGGIASLAAAVFLITDAKVPASNIHIFDLHSHAGGGIRVSGDATTGYVSNSRQHISFHDSCIERLLSLVPYGKESIRTLWSEIISVNNQQNHHERPVNRLLVEGAKGLKPLRAKSLGLDLHSQMELIKLMLDSKDMLYGKSIADTFHADFFATKFWLTWSTT
jgi:oleate hydratase